MSKAPSSASLFLYPALAWFGSLGLAGVFIFIVEKLIVARLSWV